MRACDGYVTGYVIPLGSDERIPGRSGTGRWRRGVQRETVKEKEVRPEFAPFIPAVCMYVYDRPAYRRRARAPLHLAVSADSGAMPR